MRKMKSFLSMKAKLMREERQPNNASIKKNATKHKSITFSMQNAKMKKLLFHFH